MNLKEWSNKKNEVIQFLPLQLSHHSLSDATYDLDTQKMFIDLKECKKFARGDKTDFYEYVARCINHEFIHHLLNNEQNEQTTYDFDNIARKYVEYWLW